LLFYVTNKTTIMFDEISNNKSQLRFLFLFGINYNASSIDNLFISEDDYDVIIEANRKQISEKQSGTITLLKRIRLMQKKWKLIIKVVNV